MTAAEAAPSRESRPRRTQEQRRDEAEAALIEAAAELIAQGGSAALTLAKVGDRAGYSRGLANHHFGGKAQLMQRVVQAVRDDFEKSIAARQEAGSVAEELTALIDIYLTAVEAPRPLNRARLVLIAEAMTEGCEFRDIILQDDRAFRRGLEAAFERGKSSGELPPDLDASGFAIATIALLRGVACQAYADPKLDIASARSEIGAVLLHRLRLA